MRHAPFRREADHGRLYGRLKNERGRLPDINSADAWEKRMAEGVAAFARFRAQAKAAQGQGEASNG